jgi:NADH-ubiquinone/plastoquinone oxidoreductase, chain 3
VLFGLVEMVVFIGLVFVAYAYIWRKGGFDWADDATPIEPEEVAERERELEEATRAG